MGTVSSKDTRRISFENSITMSSALAAKTLSLEDENILDLAHIAKVEKGKDSKLKENDKSPNFDECVGKEIGYWVGRLDQLKKEHREINQVIETEYRNTVDISTRMMERPRLPEETIRKMRPCYDYRNKIQKCYEENAQQPLVCSSIVHAFTECVKSCQDESSIYT